jgi:hypothetical protein
LSKESYRLYKKDYKTEEEARAQQRAVEPLMNEFNVAEQFIWDLWYTKKQSGQTLVREGLDQFPVLNVIPIMLGINLSQLLTCAIGPYSQHVVAIPALLWDFSSDATLDWTLTQALSITLLRNDVCL